MYLGWLWIPLPPLQVFILLVCVHFLADFICQTSWQAENKWTNSTALLEHTSTYVALLAVFFGIQFAGISWLFHTNQDAVTSRINHKYAEEKNWHVFFVSVGFDQVLHYIQLVLTYHFLIQRLG